MASNYRIMGFFAFPVKLNSGLILLIIDCFLPQANARICGDIMNNDSYSQRLDREISLRRLTIDEALWKLDKYLNDAFMAGLFQVRVIHGKGTGTLRQAIRKELEGHPLVKSYRPGNYGEGGSGVTMVDLVPR
jgi:dsDNA-specific endonuclease/ATPase MutS2